MKILSDFSDYFFLNSEFKTFFLSDIIHFIKEPLADLDFLLDNIISTSNSDLKIMASDEFLKSGKKLRAMLIFFISEVWKQKKKNIIVLSN